MELTEEDTTAGSRLEGLSESDGRKSAWSLRKIEKQFYYDEVDEDDIIGKRTFNLEERVKQTQSLSPKFYIELKGSDLTLKYFQRNGFSCPIIVRDKAGLGMRIPSSNFRVADVKRCVGSYRLLDVVDVNTQQDLVMTVKDWVQYYETSERDRLLNVISLEFSHTCLEDYVDQPEVIHSMDWVDLAWPWYLKEFQTEPTNVIEKMMYPKVQKYCLMSVKGCYTDFHIDMGGTSVWYHILKGKKIFWLIPPTEENLQLYESWTLSGKQGDVFFGDLVGVYYHILLEPGWTFFIPPGWIHAVYTPEDSLVFGGNFLHSFDISTQLRIWEIEAKTHVPSKFRYPFFIEIHWYVLERYVSCLMGKHHRIKSLEEEQLYPKDECSENMKYSQRNLSWCSKSAGSECAGNDECLSEIEQPQISTSSWISSSNDLPQVASETNLVSLNQVSDAWVNLTPYELEGLKTIVHWLESLPRQKRHLPKDITNADLLLSDAKLLLKLHILDDPEKSVTGVAVLQWLKSPKKAKRMRNFKPVGSYSKKTSVSQVGSSGKMWHYRRIRCRACEPCLRSDCGVCFNCKDMKKFGGAGRKKQTCISRRCLAPLLPHNAVCRKCGQGDQPSSHDGSYDTFLLECRICFNLMHPKCLKELNPQLSHCGFIDEDYPNSWECGKCCEAGKEGQGKHRFNRSNSVLLCEEYVQTSAPLASLLQSSEFETLSEGDMSLDVSLDCVEEDLTLIATEKTNQSEETKYMTKKGKCRQIENYDTDLKRKKGLPLNPIICLEKMPESETCNGVELQSTSVQPIDAISHQYKKKKFSSHPCWHASFSKCSSVASFPSKSSRVNSRGREIMIPRRFLQ